VLSDEEQQRLFETSAQGQELIDRSRTAIHGRKCQASANWL